MATPCIDGALTIVAHPDDDLLFFQPHLLRDIEAGRCARTVITTAGEAGEGPGYWESLEAGIRATYAQMAGVDDEWTADDAGVTPGAITVHTLVNAPHVSVAFLRLPDGLDGGGTSTYGFESLEKLWDGRISVINSVDGAEWYTRDEVLIMLAQLMTNFAPTTVRVQDWTTDLEILDDHSDHRATALFAHLANEQYTAPHTLLSYEGYPVQNFDQNVFGDDLTKTIDAFVTFVAYDMFLCADPDQPCPEPPYDVWLERQYLVNVESTRNAAREAGVTVTASSEKSSNQPAHNAMDGYPLGAPVDDTYEWATDDEGAGSWIQYTFVSPTTIDGVTLFDRPNPDDQITGATLEFSDGSTVPVPELPNNGSGLTIRFAARTVTSVRLTITSVSDTTTAVGLAEFEVWRGGQVIEARHARRGTHFDAAFRGSSGPQRRRG